MAARVYDIYDLTSPFVTPTAPATPTPQTATATRGSDKLMRGSAYLLTFAGAVLLLALIVTVSPLRNVDVDLTVPFCAVVVAALAAIVWGTVRA
jgi:hypothetical protein